MADCIAHHEEAHLCGIQKSSVYKMPFEVGCELYVGVSFGAIPFFLGWGLGSAKLDGVELYMYVYVCTGPHGLLEEESEEGKRDYRKWLKHANE